MSDLEYAKDGACEDRVIEECSELIQAICKAKRFGLRNYHPNRPGSDNYGEILSEIDDVRKVLKEYKMELEKYDMGVQ